MRFLLFVIVCLAVRSAADSDADDRALVPTTEVMSLVEVKEGMKIAGQAALATAKGGAVGCYAGAIIGALLTGGAGALPGCKLGALLAGITAFAKSITQHWSEQMRRAVLAWEVWRRSHKHLRLQVGKDVKAAFRKCAADVHPDKVDRDASAEDKAFAEEMYHDCRFAGQYIKAFNKLYGALSMDKRKEFFTTFAGRFASFFNSDTKMTEEEINAFERTARKEL